MKNRNIFSKSLYLLKTTFLEFNDDNAIKLSAALSYYTIFSLPFIDYYNHLWILFWGRSHNRAIVRANK
ncbi:hypothetical protein [Flavobacterium cheongpyeongense]|uniref:hypothetical protein n=1 Tax=Flavobacterium cheongpyeongense TaxID=2212651 RepID=UPI001E45AB60|nr:hypothetical protein [Flavobacterium cheongpyeongense]